MDLHLQNFKCFKDLRIHIPDGTLINAPSGSGKSTLFDAVRFVLWGNRSTDIVTIGKKKCLVELRYLGHTFTRTKSPARFTIIDDKGEMLESPEEYIDMYFRRPLEWFITTNDRLRYIEGMCMNVEEVNQAVDLLKQATMDTKREILTLTTRLDTLVKSRDSIPEVKENIDDPGEEVHANDVSWIKKRLALLDESISKASMSVEPFTEHDLLALLEEQQREYHAVQHAIRQEQQKLSRPVKSLNEIETRIKMIKPYDCRCPKCKVPLIVTSDSKVVMGDDDGLQSLRTLKDLLTARGVDRSDDISRLMKKKLRHEHALEYKRKYNLEDLKLRREEQARLLDSITTYKLKKDLYLTNQRIKTHRLSVEQQIIEIESSLAKNMSLIHDLNTLNEHIASARLSAVSSTVRELNIQMNKYVRSFFSQDDGIDLTLSDDCSTLSVQYRGYTMKQSNLSTGELARVRLAVDFALWTMVSTKAPILLDEVTANLDSDTSTRIFEVAKGSFNNLFVVSHQSIEGIFDHTISEV